MGLFNIDGGFSKFVNKALDVLFLNFLWLLCCIPVITVGASTCAAYSVTLKMVNEEEGYIGKMFFKAFKENFKQGTLMWIFTAVCIYVGWILWQVVIKADEKSFLLILGTIIYTAIVLAANLYVYPLIARYENTFFNMIKNSFGITIRYFGRSLLLIFLIALEIFLIMWNRWTLLAGILIGPEFIIYTVSGIAKRIFLKIENKEDENSGTINQ